MAILGPILAPAWLHFGAQDQLKSSKNTISRGIKKLIDFCIDFFSNFLPFLDPRQPQAPPKGSQDGPKRRPTGLQKTYFPPFFRSWPPRGSKGLSRPFKSDLSLIVGQILIACSLIFGRCLIDFLTDLAPKMEPLSVHNHAKLAQNSVKKKEGRHLQAFLWRDFKFCWWVSYVPDPKSDCNLQHFPGACPFSRSLKHYPKRLPTIVENHSQNHSIIIQTLIQRQAWQTVQQKR